MLAAPLLCAQCGAGPFLNDRALRTHHVRKHHLRNAIQSTNCPTCLRQFTSKSAAQRHVHKGSCGRPVRNHGHAGAIAGHRLAATVQRPRLKLGPHIDLFSAFFHPQNAGHGLSSSSHEPHREASEAQQRRREQQILGTAVQELTQHMQKLSQVVVAHDSSVRDWSTHTWLLAAESELSRHILTDLPGWCCFSQMHFR